MVTVTRELAERIASMAELLLSDDDSDAPLQPAGRPLARADPGSAGPACCRAGEPPGPRRLGDQRRRPASHAARSGDGPVAEALRYGEARRIDDSAAEERWPWCARRWPPRGFEAAWCCRCEPTETWRRARDYSRAPGCFAGSGHDVALLFAAQGGVAMRNAALYKNCQRLVQNLHIALESRAVIEQAKGILVAEYGCSPDVAFKRLSALSQNSNKKVKDIAADLVAGRIQRNQFAGDD